MPFISSRRSARLTPELDDAALGRLLESLRDPAFRLAERHIASIRYLLDSTGSDWDLRTHRISTIVKVSADTSLTSAWIAVEPQDPDALLFHAWSQVVRGLRTGSRPDAFSVTEECYQASEISPQDPIPWVILLALSRLEGCPRQDMFKVWNQVGARDPWNREAYLQMLGYLSPEESGSRMEVLEFVDSMRARMPADAPTIGLELAALVNQYQGVLKRGGVEALLARNLWISGSASKALDLACSTWPKPGFLRHAAALEDLNILAYALVSAERSADAAGAFKMLKGRVSTWPWQLLGDPVAEFERCRNKTLRCA